MPVEMDYLSKHDGNSLTTFADYETVSIPIYGRSFPPSMRVMSPRGSNGTNEFAKESQLASPGLNRRNIPVVLRV
jgi:hypothetical protein